MSELATLVKSNTPTLSQRQMRPYYVRKNKVFNPSTQKKLWDPLSYDQLATKINSAKQINFITAEPKRFHPYFVAEFYKQATIAEDEKSFKTTMHVTKFKVSAQFLAKEFGVNYTGPPLTTISIVNQASKGALTEEKEARLQSGVQTGHSQGLSRHVFINEAGHCP